jgi:hypothetical protein
MFNKLMFTVMTSTGRNENSESLTYLIKSKYNKPYAETYYTGWSESLCAPDDYNTESYK